MDGHSKECAVNYQPCTLVVGRERLDTSRLACTCGYAARCERIAKAAIEWSEIDVGYDVLLSAALDDLRAAIDSKPEPDAYRFAMSVTDQPFDVVPVDEKEKTT